MKTEYTLGKIKWSDSRERDEQCVMVTVHCTFGQFHYVCWVGPQYAQARQGQRIITEWAMEAWRNAYEEKRREAK